VGTYVPDRPDAELVQAALAGERTAVAELLVRHWDTAMFLAARVLGSTELARDAAQEAAIAAMTDLSRLRSPDRFGAWFCGIALNVSRRWQRELRAEIPLAAGECTAQQPGPDEAAEAAEVRARVRSAVAALPSGQRAAVWLFYLQGLSHREVAAELDISIGAVKARLHQARAALVPRLASVLETKEARQMTATAGTRWLDADVTEIRRTGGEHPWERKHVMILQERGGSRRLPIWIGTAEAYALAATMEAAETPRPFTAKLAASLVEAAGGRIEEVRVTRLADKIFYAATLVRGPEGVREVDSRPSDAVHVALVAGARIRVDADLFDLPEAVGVVDQVEQYPPATADVAAAGRVQLSRQFSGD
jgi:RNA polymerase sigma factor (sigma-70 family)